jgi:hypothetical protein
VRVPEESDLSHSETYVRGQVHTNGLENFWSLLKRNLKGTYVCAEPFHLERYIDEQVFRCNNRATKDNPLKEYLYKSRYRKRGPKSKKA